VYLLERPRASWQSGFDKAGLKVVAEPTFPQFGIALLREFTRLIMSVRSTVSRASVPPASGTTADAAAATMSASRLLKRAALSVLAGLRRAILLFAWPFDHAFHLPLPPPGFRHYRIFVVAPDPSVPNSS
jgi:hypothetical protein